MRGKDLSDCLERLTTLAEKGNNGKIVDLSRGMVLGYHPIDRELPNKMKNVKAVILAAGEGTRMKIGATSEFLESF